jgi:hypothetical protein
MNLKQVCNELGWRYQEKMQDELDVPNERVATYMYRELSELFYHYVNLDIPDNQAEETDKRNLVATLENTTKRLPAGSPALLITQQALTEVRERLAL